MGPELLLLALGALGIGGAGRWWGRRRAQRDHVNRVQTEWVRAGQIVHYGPVGAVCYGSRPRRTYTGGVPGAVGLAGGRLVFEGQPHSQFDVRIPFGAIQWIGLSTIPVGVGRSTRALTVHTRGADGWRVVVVVVDDPVELAQQIGQECGLPVYDSGPARDDYGPDRALRMNQDLYGEWLPDREDDLYLAPDWLLFGWRDAIPLEQVRRLDVLTQGGHAAALLRVEYEPPDSAGGAVAGFVVRGAAQWAAAIQRRIDAPVHTGRKKKE